MSGERNFRRSEVNPGAVISTDAAGLEAYRKRRARRAEINRALDEQQSMKVELAEVKDMLSKILRILEK